MTKKNGDGMRFGPLWSGRWGNLKGGGKEGGNRGENLRKEKEEGSIVSMSSKRESCGP